MGNKIKLEFSSKSYLLIAIVVLAVGGLNELSQLSIYPLSDVFLKNFNISTTQFQHILGIFFIAGFFATLVTGLLARMIGSGTTMLAGTIFCIGGACAILFSSIVWHIVFGRVLFGLGCGVLTTIAPAVIMRVFEHDRSIRIFGLYRIVFNATMIFAVGSIIFTSSGIVSSFFGGYLTHHMNWRWIFALVLVVFFVYLLLLSVNIKNLNKVSFDKKRNLLSGIKSIFSNVSLFCFIVSQNLLVLANTAFFITAPVIYMHYFKINAYHFGIIFCVSISFSIVSSAIVSIKKQFKKPFVLVFSCFVLLILNNAVLLFLAVGHELNWCGLLLISGITNFLLGFSGPIVQKKMMDSSDKQYELAASFSQSVVLFVCWLAAIIAVFIHVETSLVPIFTLLLVCYFFSLVLLVLAYKFRRVAL